MSKLRHTVLDGPAYEEFFKSYRQGVYVTFKAEARYEFTCRITDYRVEDNSGSSFLFRGVDDCDRTFNGWYNTETHQGWIEW